jgi:hypothetical protein
MGAPAESPFAAAVRRRRIGWRQALVATGIGVVCMVLAFRGVDRARLFDLLARTSPGFLLLAASASLLSIAIRCLKIGALLRPVQAIAYRTLLSAELVSVLVDTLLPVRTNYLVRAYMIGRRSRVPAAYVLGAEVVEKIAEVLLLTAGLLVLGLAVRFPPWAATPVRLLIAAAGTALALLVIVVRWPVLGRRPAEWFLRMRAPWRQRIGHWLARMTDGISQTAARPSALLWLLLLTTAEWTALTACFWAAAQAVGVPLTALQAVGLLAANHLAFAIPASTSGAVGVYEVTVSTALVLLFGMAREEALSLALVAHAVLISVALAGGLAGLRLARPPAEDGTGPDRPDSAAGRTPGERACLPNSCHGG